MTDIGNIPVTVAGPGSQPQEEDGARLDYIAMPQTMDRFQAPPLPEPRQVGHLTAARAVMDWLQQALDRYRGDGKPQSADISALDAENRELVNQILGEGEVSVRYSGETRARAQESVLAGVWRTLHLDDAGGIARDLIEVGDVPALALGAADAAAPFAAGLTRGEPPPGAMNAMAILSELQEHLRACGPGRAAWVVNLTLLPLSDADRGFLDERLGQGPVEILSRGYGDCRVASSACPNLWRVRYYNAMGSLILDTLEVVAIPVVVRAAPEDLDDSRRRLRELLEPYWRELGS